MFKKLPDFFIKIILVIISLSFLFPFVWVLELSFKNGNEVYQNPFLLPHMWDFGNYLTAMSSYNFMRLLINSCIYTAVTVIFTILVASLFSYATSRMDWKFGNAVVVYVSLGLIIPIPVIIIPVYMILKFFHLMGSYLTLILPYTAMSLASASLMFFAFFRTLPKELEQSAYIDGCSIYRSFFSIILPIVKPAIASQVIFIFINIWNEFYLALILCSKPTLLPLTTGIMNFFAAVGSTDWGIIGAAMVISSLPILIVYLIFSEQIENALTAGAILK